MKMEFKVITPEGERTVKDGILFEVTDTGNLIVHDGTENTYTALVEIQKLTSKIILQALQAVERSLTRQNGVMSDDLK